jgi:hypothetical protein
MILRTHAAARDDVEAAGTMARLAGWLRRRG